MYLITVTQLIQNFIEKTIAKMPSCKHCENSGESGLESFWKLSKDLKYNTHQLTADMSICPYQVSGFSLCPSQHIKQILEHKRINEKMWKYLTRKPWQSTLKFQIMQMSSLYRKKLKIYQLQNNEINSLHTFPKPFYVHLNMKKLTKAMILTI